MDRRDRDRKKAHVAADWPVEPRQGQFGPSEGRRDGLEVSPEDAREALCRVAFARLRDP